MLDKQTNEWNYSNRKNHLLTGIVFVNVVIELHTARIMEKLLDVFVLVIRNMEINFALISI